MARTGEEIDLLTGHTGRVYSVAFSADGKWIATGSNDDTVVLWDAQTGEQKGTFVWHAGHGLFGCI